MSRWQLARGLYHCSRCPDVIYPQDVMRFDDDGRAICQDCGGWPH